MKRGTTGWRCAVKKIERERRVDYRSSRNRRRRARWATDPEYRESQCERIRTYYHRPDGGWLKKRKRELAASREGVLQRMEELDESFS